MIFPKVGSFFPHRGCDSPPLRFGIFLVFRHIQWVAHLGNKFFSRKEVKGRDYVLCQPPCPKSLAALRLPLRDRLTAC